MSSALRNGKPTAQGMTLDLCAWHAEPLPQEALHARLAGLRGASGFEARLEDLRLRLMLGLPCTMQREVLLSEAADELGRAAVELICGQVMLAQRQSGAWTWLDAAQGRLAQRLPGPCFREILQRHARLRPLTLFPAPRPIRPLAELLAIAAATARLEGRRRPAYTPDRRDTLG